MARAAAGKIDAITPSSGSAGETAVVTGKGFGNGDVGVTVGGVVAIVSSSSGKSATFTVPSGVAAGPTTVVLTNAHSTIGSIAFVVIAPANQAPVPNAGPDQTVYLPASATLNGSVTDDGLPAGSTVTVGWVKASGPGTVTFSNPTAPVTSASFSEAGIYTLRLIASDSEQGASDDVVVTVVAANQAQVVNAGPDLTVYLPATATLNGSVTDDGLPVGSTLTIGWSKVSGPGTVTFSNASAASTTASFSEAGNYVLRLTASDGEFTVSDDVAVTVFPANQPPVVNAGPDETVYLPANATLNGSVTDDGYPVGSTITISWSMLSGPGTVTFSNANAASTTASFSEPGIYVLRLTASDGEFTVSDDARVTVLTPNQPPVVSAGPDETVYLPANATLNGSVTDDGYPAGSTVTISWSKVSGPGSVTFSNANAASTTASFSEAGIYTLRLNANDTEFSTSDDVVVTVLSANQPPVVNAGPDQTIVIVNNATLSGSVTDDGLPAGSTLTIGWAKVSGPGSVTFSNPNSATSIAAFSLPGTYVLRLTATDTEFTVSDDVIVIVAP